MTDSTWFYLLAGLLMLIACMAIVWPLHRARTSQRSHMPLAAVLCAFTLIATAGLYVWLGTPAALQPQNLVAEQPAFDPNKPITQDDIDQAIERVRERLAAEPENVEGWVMLARLYEGTERFDEAVDAYQNARKHDPNNPNIAVDLAKARTEQAPNKVMPDDAIALLDQALLTNPTHQQALWFRGMAHVQRKQPNDAIAVWERLLPLMPEGNAKAAVIKQISHLQQANNPATAPNRAPANQPANKPTNEPAAQGKTVEVIVHIAPELQNKLTGNEALFVFARAAQGPPMPIAAKKLSVGTWPVTITLSDADNAMPTRTLSQFDTVRLGARISSSGNAMPQSSDWEAKMVEVNGQPGEPIKLIIDNVRP